MIRNSKDIALKSSFQFVVTELKQLVKFNLSMTVVFSSLMAYLIVAAHQVSIFQFLILALGGSLVTFSANIFNELLEIEFDTKMKRTQIRPLVTGTIKNTDAILLAGIFAVFGTLLLLSFNLMSGFIGLFSIILYAFVYTPMKRISNISVFVGAIAGALPLIIGCTAFEDGKITPIAILLFLIQFFWQFPHFWAIAWLGHEDYSRAEFKLLPNSKNELNPLVGKQAFYYSFLLIPITFYMQFYGYISSVGFLVAILPVLWMMFCAYKLSMECTKEAAKKLMFSSLIFLPIFLFTILIDQYI